MLLCSSSLVKASIFGTINLLGLSNRSSQTALSPCVARSIAAPLQLISYLSVVSHIVLPVTNESKPQTVTLSVIAVTHSRLLLVALSPGLLVRLACTGSKRRRQAASGEEGM